MPDGLALRRNSNAVEAPAPANSVGTCAQITTHHRVRRKKKRGGNDKTRHRKTPKAASLLSAAPPQKPPTEPPSPPTRPPPPPHQQNLRRAPPKHRARLSPGDLGDRHLEQGLSQGPPLRAGLSETGEPRVRRRLAHHLREGQERERGEVRVRAVYRLDGGTDARSPSSFFHVVKLSSAHANTIVTT